MGGGGGQEETVGRERRVNKGRRGDGEEKLNVNSLFIISRISISESGICLNM